MGLTSRPFNGGCSATVKAAGANPCRAGIILPHWMTPKGSSSTRSLSNVPMPPSRSYAKRWESVAVLSRFTTRLGAWDTAIKKTLRASEQERADIQSRREAWLVEQEGLDLQRVVFVDESGAKTNMTRFRGRIKGKARLRVSAPAGHWATATMISSIRLDGKRACMCVDGSTTSYEFAFIHRAPVQREIRGHLRGHEKNANGVP